VLLAAVPAAGAANSNPGAAPASSPPAARTPGSAAVLAHLNSAIGWYRSSQAAGAWVARPSDGLYFDSQRDLAASALRLAFTAAEAQAVLIGSQRGAASTPGRDTPERSAMLRTAGSIAGRMDELQSEIAALDRRLKATLAADQASLVAQRGELQGELDFEASLEEAAQRLVSSTVGTRPAGEAAGLSDQIDDLRNSVPEVFADPPLKAPQAARVNGAESGGLIERASALFGLLRDLRGVEQLARTTARLRSEADQLAAPLRDSIREVIRQGGAATDRARRAGAGDLPAVRGEFEALSARFKQISAANVPLRQESLALAQSERNLQDWRDSLDQEYRVIAHALVLRGAVIAAAVAALLLLSEGWRQVTFRYVREARRRRQLLLARRIVTGVLLAAVVVLGFVSDFGSIATFAGFITAGVAVALQTVIVSVAAYFFIVGRYGIRIGDRITVAGVTGEVAEIGLVRFYLMELAGTGSNLHPTGRIVMFANSVLFQNSPLYKQIPGTDYLWHQVVLPLAADCNLTDVETRLLAEVNAVYGEYRPVLERQHDAIERLIDFKLAVPTPVSRIRYVEAGPEIAIRYPVETRRASEIDEQLAQRLRAAIGAGPPLSQAIRGQLQIETTPRS
jgi:small-conductance mechanosensitive channel